MDKPQFKSIIRECIEEVLKENLLDNDPLYVEYHSDRKGEEPFMLGGTKYQYVNAKYPDGKIDIGVYSYAGDVVYSYNAFRSRNNLRERKEKWIQKAVNPKHKGYCTPMSKPTCTPRRKALARRFKKGLEETEIAPETPYGVIDTKTGQVVYRTTYKDRNRARRFADRKDLEYGAHRYMPTVLKKEGVREMTGTSAVQGFYGKNWVDPDPKRSRMKSIAKKSVGGDLA